MKNRIAVIILVVLICVIGIIVGVKYYNFMENDPAFCGVCHMTQEGYNSWQTSKHFEIICQDCHRMTIMEGNRLLMAYYVKGEKNLQQDHGRKTPWDICMNCHSNEAAQGSITFRSSYGHAKHIFMHEIKCQSCHSGRLHDLSVDAAKCRVCHTDKLVHGMGTTGLNCLNCHRFSDSHEKMISSEACRRCHEELPTEGIMSNLKCHDCHHPHNKIKLTNDDCLGNCHSSETRVGQHANHIEKYSQTCLDCHRPHTWAVRKDNAPGLCDKCHKMKDPGKFIY